MSERKCRECGSRNTEYWNDYIQGIICEECFTCKRCGYSDEYSYGAHQEFHGKLWYRIIYKIRKAIGWR